MHRIVLSVTLMSIVGFAGAALAQQKPSEPTTIATVLNRQLSDLEHDFVPAAEAMPEDKFGFAPTNGEFKGVRNFRQQIKHVAAANYLVAAAILQEKPPDIIKGEDGPENITSKTEVLQFLKDSFLYTHKAFATLNGKNATAPIQNPFGSRSVTRLDLSTEAIGHCFNHYGQMVEYLRMNGIIPPASRGQ